MNTFPIEKIGTNRKELTEADMLASLVEGALVFPPVTIQPLPGATYGARAAHGDGVIDVHWRDKGTQYVVECKSSNSPKSLESAVWSAQAAANETGLLPLVFVPFLGADALRKLEELEVSGLDMCGNGLLTAPDFRIMKSGAPNIFRDSRPIRNPFRGDSSIFARMFLLQPEYKSLDDLRTSAFERTFETGGQLRKHACRGTETSFGEIDAAAKNVLSLSTASKVVSSLVEELILVKEGHKIRLIDRRRLLELLRSDGRESNRTGLTGKTPFRPEEIWVRLTEARDRLLFRSVVTGLGSAQHYGALAGVDSLSLYVDDIDQAARLLEIQPGRPFANIELFEERKNVVYFDARREGDVRWASPIQTWLELASAGPRERQAAEALDALLLAGKADSR